MKGFEVAKFRVKRFTASRPSNSYQDEVLSTKLSAGMEILLRNTGGDSGEIKCERKKC